MKLTKITALLLATTLALSAANSVAIVKPTKPTTNQKVSAPTKKAATSKVVVKKKTVQVKNHSKTHYGVKGATLQPTKISGAMYQYREKGKIHKTIGKEASRQYGQTGIASYYGGMFHGRKTANGEIFNENSYTAAHKTLALGSYALVTNLRNGRKLIVKINDRGPFSKDRILDLSKGAARELGMLHSGVARVRVEAMQVDRHGYISGKGANALYQLAMRMGLPLKVKQIGDEIAFKADESASREKKAQASLKRGKASEQAVKKAEKSAKTVADTKTVKGKEAAKHSPKAVVKTEQPAIKGAKVTVVTQTEKEAKRIALQVKQQAVVRKTGDHFSVIIAVADKAESGKVQKQVKKLSHYKSINYSSK